jgi:hypothetical protein
MVGMVIGLLTVGAMLSSYKILVGTSVPATRTAMRESQATSAIIIAQLELQQAGFGLNPTEAAPKIQLLNNDRRIVWAFRDAPGQPITCAGLELDSDGIYLLATAPCSNANDGTALVKRRIATAAVLFEPAAGEARSYSLSTAKFALSAKPGCGHYGVAGFGSASQLVELKDGTKRVFAHCLSNL